MRRKKIDLKPCLKAQDFVIGQVVKPTCFITDVYDVETKFGDGTIIALDDGDSIFMNMRSNNNLIDSYGDDDKIWIGKGIRIVCETDVTFNKKMLVAYPIV